MLLVEHVLGFCILRTLLFVVADNRVAFWVGMGMVSG